jgi:hypothetical protein
VRLCSQARRRARRLGRGRRPPEPEPLEQDPQALAAGVHPHNGQQHQSDPGTAVVAAESRERLAHPCTQIDPPQMAPEQFHDVSAWGTNRIVRSPLTTRRRVAIVKHQRGLQCERECIGMLSLETALEASLIHGLRSLPSRLFADWGQLYDVIGHRRGGRP